MEGGPKLPANGPAVFCLGGRREAGHGLADQAPDQSGRQSV